MVSEIIECRSNIIIKHNYSPFFADIINDEKMHGVHLLSYCKNMYENAQLNNYTGVVWGTKTGSDLSPTKGSQ